MPAKKKSTKEVVENNVSEEIDETEQEIDDLEEALEQFKETTLEESKNEYDDDISDISLEELDKIKAFVKTAEVGVHEWVLKQPIIVKPISNCYFSNKAKYEQFDAKIIVMIDKKPKIKTAKVNVFGSMRNQFQKLTCPLKNGKTDTDNMDYQKNIKGKTFTMIYQGTTPSLKYKDGKPAKSIIVDLLK